MWQNEAEDSEVENEHKGDASDSELNLEDSNWVGDPVQLLQDPLEANKRLIFQNLSADRLGWYKRTDTGGWEVVFRLEQSTQHENFYICSTSSNKYLCLHKDKFYEIPPYDDMSVTELCNKLLDALTTKFFETCLFRHKQVMCEYVTQSYFGTMSSNFQLSTIDEYHIVNNEIDGVWISNVGDAPNKSVPYRKLNTNHYILTFIFDNYSSGNFAMNIPDTKARIAHQKKTWFDAINQLEWENRDLKSKLCEPQKQEMEKLRTAAAQLPKLEGLLRHSETHRSSILEEIEALRQRDGEQNHRIEELEQQIHALLEQSGGGAPATLTPHHSNTVATSPLAMNSTDQRERRDTVGSESKQTEEPERPGFDIESEPAFIRQRSKAEEMEFEKTLLTEEKSTWEEQIAHYEQTIGALQLELKEREVEASGATKEIRRLSTSHDHTQDAHTQAIVNVARLKEEIASLREENVQLKQEQPSGPLQPPNEPISPLQPSPGDADADAPAQPLGGVLHFGAGHDRHKTYDQLENELESLKVEKEDLSEAVDNYENDLSWYRVQLADNLQVITKAEQTVAAERKKMTHLSMAQDEELEEFIKLDIENMELKKKIQKYETNPELADDDDNVMDGDGGGGGEESSANKSEPWKLDKEDLTERIDNYEADLSHYRVQMAEMTQSLNVKQEQIRQLSVANDEELEETILLDTENREYRKEVIRLKKLLLEQGVVVTTSVDDILQAHELDSTPPPLNETDDTKDSTDDNKPTLEGSSRGSIDTFGGDKRTDDVQTEHDNLHSKTRDSVEASPDNSPMEDGSGDEDVEVRKHLRERTREQLESDVVKYIGETQDLRSDLENYEEDLTQYRVQLADSLQTVEKMESAHKNEIDKVTRMSSVLDTQIGEFMKVDAQNVAYERQIEELRTEIRRLKGENVNEEVDPDVMDTNVDVDDPLVLQRLASPAPDTSIELAHSLQTIQDLQRQIDTLKSSDGGGNGVELEQKLQSVESERNTLQIKLDTALQQLEVMQCDNYSFPNSQTLLTMFEQFIHEYHSPLHQSISGALEGLFPDASEDSPEDSTMPTHALLLNYRAHQFLYELLMAAYQTMHSKRQSIIESTAHILSMDANDANRILIKIPSLQQSIWQSYIHCKVDSNDAIDGVNDDSSVQSVCSQIFQQYDTWQTVIEKFSERIQKYVIKCCELSWLMVLSTPNRIGLHPQSWSVVGSDNDTTVANNVGEFTTVTGSRPDCTQILYYAIPAVIEMESDSKQSEDTTDSHSRYLRLPTVFAHDDETIMQYMIQAGEDTSSPPPVARQVSSPDAYTPKMGGGPVGMQSIGEEPLATATETSAIETDSAHVLVPSQELMDSPLPQKSQSSDDQMVIVSAEESQPQSQSEPELIDAEEHQSMPSDHISSDLGVDLVSADDFGGSSDALVSETASEPISDPVIIGDDTNDSDDNGGFQIHTDEP